MKRLKVPAIVTALMIVVLVVLSQIGGYMTTLTHQIQIDAPKDRVFATLANLELVAKYNPAIESAKYITPNKTGIGAARECSLGKQGIVREKVTAFQDGKSITMEMYEHNWPLEFMHWTTQVNENGSKTIVTQTLSYQMKFGLIGAALDKFLMRKKLETTLEDVFKSMKNFIEINN